MCFFIPMALMALEPFRCEQHPNDLRTMVSDPAILCFDDEDDDADSHSTFVALGGLAIAVYPVGMLATSIYLSVRHDHLLARYGSAFVVASKGLFARFRPDASHFAALLLLRNFAKALAPTLFPRERAVKLITFGVCIFGWGMLQASPTCNKQKKTKDFPVCLAAMGLSRGGGPRPPSLREIGSKTGPGALLHVNGHAPGEHLPVAPARDELARHAAHGGGEPLAVSYLLILIGPKT